jgi:hypothetical protein
MGTQIAATSSVQETDDRSREFLWGEGLQEHSRCLRRSEVTMSPIQVLSSCSDHPLSPPQLGTSLAKLR